MTVESRAKLLGHAIHPMLIVFPLCLLSKIAVFDILYLALSLAALVVGLFIGWLGGELVEWLGFGVDSGAHLDAPISFSPKRMVDDTAETRQNQREAA